MTSSTISLVVIGLFIVVLLAGFLFGLARGFNKSLVRVFLVIGCVVAAFFLARVITNAIMEVNIYNMGINIAGERVSTLKGALQALLNQVEAIRELSETAAYATIMEVVPKMIVNVAMFLVVFLVLRLLTMIVYWIIAGTVFSKKKTEGKNKHRLLGSLVGVVQNFLIFLVLLVPVFGVTSLFGDIERITTSSAVETTATSIDGENYVALMEASEGEISPIEDSQFGHIYQTVNQVISTYNETWVAKFLTGVKLDKVCLTVFDRLSTVEKNGVKYNLQEEVRSFAHVYKDGKDLLNIIKESAGEGEDPQLDLTKTEQIDAVERMIEDCYKSKLAANLIDEAIPLAIQKWNNGEKFIGIAKPSIGENYQGVLDSLLEKLGTNGSKKTIILSTIDMVKSLLTAAKSIEDASGEITIDTISNLIEDIASNPDVKDLAQDVILSQLDTIAETLLPVDNQEVDGETVDVNEEYREIVKEIVSSIITEDYSEESGNVLANEINVITEALSVYEKMSNNEEITEEDAINIVEALDNSTVILEELTNASSAFAQTIKNEIDGTPAQDAIKDAIDSLENVQNKEDLYAIFGIIVE